MPLYGLNIAIFDTIRYIMPSLLDGSGPCWLSPLYATRNSVVFSLDLNKPSVLIERRPGLKEFQTEGTEKEKGSQCKSRSDC